LQHYRWAVEKRQSAGRLACFDRLLAEIRAEEEKALKSVSSGLVHNDLNDHNTIVGRDDDSTPKIRGLIDLGDLCVERHCFSLGNTLFYMMLTLPLERVLEAARSVVQGYISRNPLSPEVFFCEQLICN
jgi:Ser/Thr protein kinase RdoA (MazF antagonist)